jgi:hypothetical protein
VDHPQASKLYCLDFTGATQPAKPTHRQVGKAGGATEAVAEGLAGELFGKMGTGFVAVDIADDGGKERVGWRC